MTNSVWARKPAAPKPGTHLCLLEDIPDGEAKGFVFTEGQDQFRMLVVRDYKSVYGYMNECPHAFTPLDFNEDDFMDMGGDYLHCATHGALFQVEDGLCIAGPCRNESLTPVPVKLDGDTVVVAE